MKKGEGQARGTHGSRCWRGPTWARSQPVCPPLTASQKTDGLLGIGSQGAGCRAGRRAVQEAGPWPSLCSPSLAHPGSGELLGGSKGPHPHSQPGRTSPRLLSAESCSKTWVSHLRGRFRTLDLADGPSRTPHLPTARTCSPNSYQSQLSSIQGGKGPSERAVACLGIVLSSHPWPSITEASQAVFPWRPLQAGSCRASTCAMETIHDF